MRMIASRWNARAAFGIGVAVVIVFLGVTALSADPIVWSWEQELEPLDILEYVEDLPYDEWIEIDEVTCRQLFEDLIQRSLEQMEIDGGHFEQMLRERFFYFTPEREYYFPPYEEDVSQREALFPVKIMRESSEYCDEAIRITLGRVSDDEREVKIFIQAGHLDAIKWTSSQYYPGETGPKKTIEALIGFFEDGVFGSAIVLNDDGSIFAGARRTFEYGIGISSPVVDNTAGELPSHLNGIGLLFDLPYSWHSYGSALFQTYTGFVWTLAHQLGIEESPYELERFLWRDILYYEDGFDYFGVYVEFANVERLRDLDVSMEEFLFDVGNAYTARYINVVLSQEYGDPDAGYEWGIESMVLTRNILVSDNEVGQEKKELTIRETSSGVVLECWVTHYDADGEEIARWQIARFEEGNPKNLAFP
jgi:hypothetical protein